MFNLDGNNDTQHFHQSLITIELTNNILLAKLFYFN